MRVHKRGLKCLFIKNRQHHGLAHVPLLMSEQWMHIVGPPREDGFTVSLRDQYSAHGVFTQGLGLGRWPGAHHAPDHMTRRIRCHINLYRLLLHMHLNTRSTPQSCVRLPALLLHPRLDIQHDRAS